MRLRSVTRGKVPGGRAVEGLRQGRLQSCCRRGQAGSGAVFPCLPPRTRVTVALEGPVLGGDLYWHLPGSFGIVIANTDTAIWRCPPPRSDGASPGYPGLCGERCSSGLLRQPARAGVQGHLCFGVCEFAVFRRSGEPCPSWVKEGPVLRLCLHELLAPRDAWWCRSGCLRVADD